MKAINSTHEPSAIQKALDKLIIAASSGDAKKVEDAINDFNQVSALANDLENLKTLGHDIKEVLKAINAGEDIANPLNALGTFLKKQLEKWAEKELEKIAEETLESNLQDQFDGTLSNNYETITAGPMPATVDIGIGHGPEVEHPRLMISLVMTGGDVSGAAAGNNSFVVSKAKMVDNKPTDDGKITGGSSNVTFNGKPVARVTDDVTCKFHGTQQIAEGSKTVFANGWPIARKGNKTTCNGIIKAGVDTISIDTAVSSDFHLCVNIGTGATELNLLLVVAGKDPIVVGGQIPCPEQVSSSNEPGS